MIAASNKGIGGSKKDMGKNMEGDGKFDKEKSEKGQDVNTQDFDSINKKNFDDKVSRQSGLSQNSIGIKGDKRDPGSKIGSGNQLPGSKKGIADKPQTSKSGKDIKGNMPLALGSKKSLGGKSDKSLEGKSSKDMRPIGKSKKNLGGDLPRQLPSGRGSRRDSGLVNIGSTRGLPVGVGSMRNIFKNDKGKNQVQNYDNQGLPI